MKSTLRLLVFSLAVSVIITPLNVGAFSDVGRNTPYREAIEDLQNKKVIAGYTDGTFKPNTTLNRAEFVRIVVQLLLGTERGGSSTCTRDPFRDVSCAEWYGEDIAYAKKKGFIAGYSDGTFKPNQRINVAEAAKILALAFEQKPQDIGGEWYESSVTALESSRALPTSLRSFDAFLTRGEMAEMMWRLSTKRTDQPTTTLLNLRYPALTVAINPDAPVRGATCGDLGLLMQQRQEQMLYKTNGMMEDRAVVPMPAMAGQEARSDTTGATPGSVDYSRTNVQVAGVDEGDIVKTDGKLIVVLRRTDGTIRVVQAQPTNEIKVLSAITVPSGVTVSELYLKGSALIAVGNSWSNDPLPMAKIAPSILMPPYYNQSRTVVFLYDLSHPSSPSLIRTLTFEGNAISSRLLEGRLVLVTQSSPWFIPLSPYASRGLLPSDVIPRATDSASVLTPLRCQDVWIVPHHVRPQYMVVATIPLQKNGDVQQSAILGNGEDVYVSLKNLYVAGNDWQYDWSIPGGGSERTRLYRFSLSSAGTTFAATGVVPGHILNQFAMDEYDGNFRIATTINQTWLTGDAYVKSENRLTILSPNLTLLGELTGIAAGESIYAVRFLGSRAYIVTFKQIDPLFVIDTSNPRQPKILGELKIPGYSSYLHPIDQNHVLGIGKEVDPTIDAEKVHGDDAVYYTAVLGVKVALFDVSNVKEPQELSKLVIGDRGSDTPVNNDHKALLFDSERKFFALPISVFSKRTSPKQNDWESDTEQTYQGAYILDYDLASGLSIRGRISHATAESTPGSGETEVHRILRIGETLYTVSDALIKSHVLSSLVQQGSTSLTGSIGECPGESASYVSRDPATCSRLRFSCVKGKVPFSSSCGCGCRGE